MNDNREITPMNQSPLSKKIKEPGFLREMWHQARLVVRLMADPDVPIYLKLLPALTLVYLIFPIDLLPDPLLGLGQLDDLTVLLIGSRIFVELAPQFTVHKHMKAIREEAGYDWPGMLPAPKDEIAEQIVIEGEHDMIKKSPGEL